MSEPISSRLIFLVSLPRSGSTLLQRIIAGHERVYSTTEPWLMLHPTYALAGEGISSDYGSELARQGLDDFLSAIGESTELYRDAIRAFAGVLYGRALEKSGKEFFLDKTPRYYLILSNLIALFPSAKFILLRRNPLAVLSSVLSTWFGDDFEKMLGTYHRHDVLRGPRMIADAIGAESSVHVVCYEELVSAPDAQLRDLFKFLDLEYTSDLVNYGLREAPIGRFGDPKSVHLHDRPVTEYVDTWVEFFSRSEARIDIAVRYLETIGHETVRDLGYEPAELLEKIFEAKKGRDEPAAS